MKKHNTFAMGLLLTGTTLFGVCTYQMFDGVRLQKKGMNKLAQLNDSIVQHGKALAQMGNNLHEVEVLNDQNVLMFVDAGGDYLSLDEHQEHAVMKRDSLKKEFTHNVNDMQQVNAKSYAHIGGVVTGFGLAVMGGFILERPRKKRKKLSGPIAG